MIVLVDGFESGVIDRIVTLVAPNAAENAALLRAGIGNLFTKVWQALTWEDLLAFSSEDVVTAGVQDNIPEEMKSPVIVKKLECIIDYAQYGRITDDKTMNDIVKRVNKASGASSARSSNPSSPSRRSALVFNKKAVPTLPGR